MPSSPSESGKKVPSLSLASLRRQLHIAETAVNGYDFVTNTLPIMTSLQSPTTRTLHAIAANRAHFLALEEEIQKAKAVERSLQSLVDESEALRSTPLLANFKGNVENEMEKVSTERAIEELRKSEAPVTATVLLQKGPKATGIKTSLSADGEVIITTPDAVTKPVALGATNMPTHFVPDTDDAIATDIVEQIVFTLPRDAAGTMLEVVPSTLLTAAENRERERREHASRMRHTTTSHLNAEGEGEVGGGGAQGGDGKVSLNNSTAANLNYSSSAPFGFSGRSALSASMASPLGKKKNAEPQSLTEALCWGAGALPHANNTSQKRNNNTSSSSTTSMMLMLSTMPTSNKSLKELLAEQDAMASATSQKDKTYTTQMKKFTSWQERRLDLLSQFTRLDGDEEKNLASGSLSQSKTPPSASLPALLEEQRRTLQAIGNNSTAAAATPTASTSSLPKLPPI